MSDVGSATRVVVVGMVATATSTGSEVLAVKFVFPAYSAVDGVRDPGPPPGRRPAGWPRRSYSGLAEIVAAIPEENGARWVSHRRGRPERQRRSRSRSGRRGLLRGGRQDGGGGRRCHALVGRAGGARVKAVLPE